MELSRRTWLTFLYSVFIIVFLLINRLNIFKVSSVGAEADTTYNVIDLGTLGGSMSVAFAINDDGIVVGRAHTAAGIYHAVYWDNGVIHDLEKVSSNSSLAYDINNSGVIVGWTRASGSSDEQAVIWKDSSVININGTFVNSMAVAVNDVENVTGDYSSSSNDGAFYWSSGSTTDLGIIDGEFSAVHALDISTSNAVVGYAEGELVQHAFLWQGVEMVDLHNTDRCCTHARGLNDSGKIVGSYTFGANIEHAALWSDGSFTDLGVLGGDYLYSVANKINNNGQIVGYSAIPGGASKAVKWENGQIIDLNSKINPGSGWVLSNAYDINEQGEIVGAGKIGSIYHGFLLVPVDVPPTSTSTPTASPSSTSTATSTATATATNTPTGTLLPHSTATSSPTATRTLTATVTSVPTQSGPLYRFVPMVIGRPLPTATSTPTKTATVNTPTQKPTVRPSATATKKPTAKPSATATAKPTTNPYPVGVILMPNYTYRYASTGSLYIYGEVLNNTPGWVKYVEITVNLFNNGRLVATDYTFTDLDSVGPYEKAGFWLIVSDPVPAWTNMSFEPISYWTGANPRPKISMINMSMSINPYTGTLKILGQLKNNEDKNVCYASAHVTIFNYAGKVVHVDYTFANSTTLVPGQASSFEMYTTSGLDLNYPMRFQTDGSTTICH